LGLLPHHFLPQNSFIQNAYFTGWPEKETYGTLLFAWLLFEALKKIIDIESGFNLINIYDLYTKVPQA